MSGLAEDFELHQQINGIGFSPCSGYSSVFIVLAVKNVFRAAIFLNFRYFGTKRDTIKKLKSNS